MRNMMPPPSSFTLLPLVALLLRSASVAAAPYSYNSNHGYYEPYPPAPSQQVLYEFSPLEDRGGGGESVGMGGDGDSDGGEPRSRETRDLSWREDVDAFLSGAKEPTCEQLRQMWRVARDIQQRRSVRTNRVPEDDVKNFVRFSPLNNEEEEEEEEEEAPKADRRRLSVPPRARGRSSRDDDDDKDGDVVYGVVKTHEPVRANSLHVRDPAKEIYGLLRDTPSSSSSSSSNSNGSPPSSRDDSKYDWTTTVHTHDTGRPRQESYLDKLRRKLNKEKLGTDSSSSSSYGNRSHYGVVRYNEPDSSSSSSPSSSKSPSSPSPSSFDRVRDLLASEEEAEQRGGGGRDSFDLIRERLMNTRLTSGRRTAAARLHGARSKALRRKGAHHNQHAARQHRRRNVSIQMVFIACA